MFGRLIVAGFLAAAAGAVGVSPASALATDWTSVSAGDFHPCAIRSFGKLYCWGSDGSGQLGNGPTAGNVISPQQV